MPHAVLGVPSVSRSRKIYLQCVILKYCLKKRVVLCKNETYDRLGKGWTEESLGRSKAPKDLAPVRSTGGGVALSHKNNSLYYKWLTVAVTRHVDARQHTHESWGNRSSVV